MVNFFTRFQSRIDMRETYKGGSSDPPPVCEFIETSFSSTQLEISQCDGNISLNDVQNSHYFLQKNLKIRIIALEMNLIQ